MKKIITGLLAGCLVAAASAHAEQVTYEYTAQIWMFYNYDSLNIQISHPTSWALPGGTVAVGDTFKGRFSYDTSTPLRFDYNTYAGNAPNNSATAKFDASNVSYQSSNTDTAYPPKIDLADNAQYLRDYLKITTYATKTPEYSFDLSFDFRDSSQTGINGVNIPTDLQNFFGTAYFGYKKQTATSNFYILGLADITSLRLVSSVPEPETYGMLAAGLALVGIQARRRRKQAA